MSTDTDSVAKEVVEPVVNNAEVEAPISPEQGQTEQQQQPIETTDEAPSENVSQQHVPLSALQKERRKRQDVEQELKVYKELQANQHKDAIPDDSQYEPVTKADLDKHQAAIVRAVEERNWIKENPEKTEIINERLPELLKQKPNLVPAIDNATNRYEQAWEFLDKLTPKQKAALKSPPTAKKDAPGSPAAIPKAASINQAVDLMNMSDSEFSAWRQSQRKHR
jgi:hypothetical protein